MEKNLFESMDIGSNIRILEAKITELLQAFDNATQAKADVSTLHAYSPQKGQNEIRVNITISN